MNAYHFRSASPNGVAKFCFVVNDDNIESAVDRLRKDDPCWRDWGFWFFPQLTYCSDTIHEKPRFRAAFLLKPRFLKAIKRAVFYQPIKPVMFHVKQITGTVHAL